MSWTIRWRTTSFAPSRMNRRPSIPVRISSTTTSPDLDPAGRSIWVMSPLTTTLEPNPSRVRNIFICRHRRTGQDDPGHVAVLERLHRRGHRQIGLPRSGRPDGEGHRVLPDGVDVLLLAQGLRGDRPSPRGEQDVAEHLGRADAVL